MRLDIENLPSDVDLLHHLVRDMVVAVETRDDEIGRLQRIIKQLQRARFGRQSERLDPDQLALGLEDLDADIAQEEAGLPPEAPGKEQKPGRASGDRPSLPEHLPREDMKLDGVVTLTGRTGTGICGSLSRWTKSALSVTDFHQTSFATLFGSMPGSL